MSQIKIVQWRFKMKTEKMCLIYVIFPNKAEAKKTSTQLIKEKLIVCGNIIPQVESVYTWKGKIQASKECIALLKTTLKKSAAVQKKVLELHSYETPFIAKIKLDEVNSNYLNYSMKQFNLV